MSKGKSGFDKQYTLLSKVLGKGAYAEVRLGLIKNSDEKVAVKIIDKSAMSKNDLKKLNKEVRILKSLNHRNVVKVYDAFNEKDCFFIVMEYISGGELFAKIVDEENEYFNEDRSREIIRTIAQSLKYCKEQGVIHRDIKPENILLTSEEEGGEIKIADFNLSKKIDKDEVNFSTLETMCGTPNYVAPEVISGKPYDYKCDIWSLGVISFLLLSGGYLPFFIDPDYQNRDDLLQKVREGKWRFSPESAWTHVSPQAKDVVSKMLRRDPEARVGYEQLLAHPWFKSSESNTEKIDMKPMLAYNKKRKMLAAAKINEFVNKLAMMMGAATDDEEHAKLGTAQESGADGFNQTQSYFG